MTQNKDVTGWLLALINNGLILQWNHVYPSWNNVNHLSLQFILPISAPTRNAITITHGSEATGVSAIVYNCVNPTSTNVGIYCHTLTQANYTGTTHVWLYSISY